jgi:hypothetical protein
VAGEEPCPPWAGPRRDASRSSCTRACPGPRPPLRRCSWLPLRW